MKAVKKIFTGGINSDDSAYLLDPKEYLRALNIRVVTSEDGEVGNVMPVEGTTAKAQTVNNAGADITFTLPAGTNQVIGATEDTPKRRVIWCVWNSNGNHGIYCYDYDTDRVYTVLKNADVSGGLNFQQDKFIHSCAVVYGLFFWTDDHSEPRRINIEAGIKTNHPTFTTNEAPYTTPLAQSVITVIRPQPTLPMSVAYASSTTLKLVSDGYQAAYRFGFRDKELSTFSMLSKASKVTAGTTNYNGYLIFNIPITQKIPQDVDRIEAAVKYPGSKMFIQKTWTREDDAAAIDDHNNGVTPLSFNFYSDSIGVAVDDATTFKAYDNVPILAKTMEVAKDRLFFANTLTGYDTPSEAPIGFGFILPTAVTTPTNGTRVFKSGSSYKAGLVYYDEFGRSSGVVPGPTLTIPETTAGFYTGATWSFINMSSPIPTWATHYSIVRTKSKKTNFFLQFIANGFQYVTRTSTGDFNFSPTPPASTADIYGLAVRASSLFNMGYGYQYTEGDIANIYNGPTTYKLSVINQYSDYIIVEYNSSVTAASLVEIYTPVPSGAVEYYYEVGVKYPINNPGTPTRSYSVTSDFLEGDVYVKQRVLGSVTYYLEVMNMVDTNWKGWYTDAGRGLTESFGKVQRQATYLCFSEPATIGVNGMSTFNALDFTVLPNEMDTIQRIILTSKAESQGSVMLVIGEQETAAQYIGESQVFDNAGSSFLAKSSGVLGNLNLLKGSFGTLHPESVFRWRDEVVYFDVNKGAVVRYSVNGLFPISEKKLRKYWKKVSEDIKNYYRDPAEYNTANPKIPLRVLGMVDPYNEEYLMYTPKMHQVTTAGFLDDIITNNCQSFDYMFPTGATSMLLTLPLIPGNRYQIDTIFRESNVYYNGVLLNENPVFTAVPGVNGIEIVSFTQFGGSVTLCEVMKSYYEMYDGQYGVVSFSNILDKWVTQYSFVPEWMSNVGNRLVSFKDGYMYTHDGEYNRFYGVDYDSILTGVHNDDGNTPKVYNAVMIEGDAPYMVHFRTEVPNVQSTNILGPEFTVKEGVNYAAILRDRLSPNTTGNYDQKMMKGDKMRGEMLKFMVIYKPLGLPQKMKFLNLRYDQSQGHTV